MRLRLLRILIYWSKWTYRRRAYDGWGSHLYALAKYAGYFTRASADRAGCVRLTLASLANCAACAFTEFAVGIWNASVSCDAPAYFITFKAPGTRAYNNAVFAERAWAPSVFAKRAFELFCGSFENARDILFTCGFFCLFVQFNPFRNCGVRIAQTL